MSIMIDYSQFKTLIPRKDRDALSTVPFIAISNDFVLFNTASSKKISEFNYFSVGYGNDRLLLSFYRNESDSEPLLKITKAKAHNFKASFKSISTQLKEVTDAVNLGAFNYKYKLVMVNQNHAVIDLT